MTEERPLAPQHTLEEPPLPLSDSSVVEVAEDYTKRKNVFRLRTEGGSEYLFQVQFGLLADSVDALVTINIMRSSLAVKILI